MPIQFIDEEEPQDAPAGGITFMDEPSSIALGDARNLTGVEVAGFLSEDPRYAEKMSLGDYESLRKYKSELGFGEKVGQVGGALEVVFGDLGAAIKEAATAPLAPGKDLDMIESIARGTMVATLQTGGLINRVITFDKAPDTFEELQKKNPKADRAAYEALLQKDFDTFKGFQNEEAEYKRVLGEAPMPALAMGSSYFLDPSMLVPGGSAGTLTKVANRALGAAIGGAGRITRAATQPVVRAIDATAEAALRAAGDSAKVVKAAAAGTGITGALMGVPGVREAAVGYAGLKTIDKAADVATKVGDSLMGQPSRIGALEAIGRAPNATAVDRAIGAVGRAGGDVALDMASAVTGGAVSGAVIGGALGFMAEGEEGLYSGIGSGAGLGAFGAGLGRTVQRVTGAAQSQARASDLARFSESLDAPTRELFNGVVQREGIDKAVMLMDGAALLRGVLGDIGVEFTSNKQMPGARGVQFEAGDRPIVRINVEKANTPYTFAHEMFHALDAVDQFKPQAERIKQEIVGTYLAQPDGSLSLIRDGILSPAQVDVAFTQYQRKLAQAGIASREWYTTTDPQQKAGMVAKELASEYMARLVTGSDVDSMLRGYDGLTRTFLDSALINRSEGVLRDISEKIGLGTQPVESMLFRDLKPASPTLNAMMRDLIRARRNLSERIELADSKGVIITPTDINIPIVAKKTVAMGVAERRPDGTTVMKPDDTLAREDQAASTAIRAAIDATPVADFTKPHLRVVDDKVVGSGISPEQVAAINSSPAVLNHLKVAFGEVARSLEAQSTAGAGNVLFIEYGAATRRKKNRLTAGYTSKYSSGIRLTQREVAPFALLLNKGDVPYARAVDVTKLRKTAQDLAAKGKLGAYGADIGTFLSDTVRYFENISDPSGVRTRDLPGMTPEKATYLNATFGQDEKGGSRYIRSFRLDRITEIRPTGERIAASELAWTRQKMNWMPAEKMPNGQVWSSPEGFRIIEKNGKFSLYLPDGKRAGIYDSQQTAELVARMKVANGSVLVAARTILDLLVGNSANKKFEDRKYRENLVVVKTPNGLTHSRVQPSRSPMVGQGVPAVIPKFLRKLAKSPESLSLFVDKTVEWLRSGEAAFESAPGKITPWFYDKMFQSVWELSGRDANKADLYLRLIAYLSPRASVGSNFSKSYGSGITSYISEIARGNRAGTFNQTGSISKIIKEWQSNKPFGYQVDGVDNKVLNFYLNGASGLVKHLMAKGEALPPGIAAHPVLKDPLTMSRLSTNDMWEMASLSHVSEMLGIDGNVWPGFVTKKGVQRFAWSDPAMGKIVSTDGPEGLAVKETLAQTSENGVKLAARNAELREQIERARRVIAKEDTEKWTPARLKRAGPDRIELAKQRTAEALAILEKAPDQIREWDWSDLTRQERSALKFDSKSNEITVFKQTADGGLSAKGEGPLYDFVQALNGMVADKLNETGGFGGRQYIDAFNVQELKWAMMKGENPVPTYRSYESYLAPVMEVLKFVDSGFKGEVPEAILTAERAFNRWGEQLVAGEVATEVAGEWSDALAAARARLKVAGDPNPDTSVLNAIAQRLPTWVADIAKKFGLDAKVESMRVGTGAYMGDGAVPVANSAIYVFGSGSDFSKLDAAMRGAGSQQGGSHVRQLKAEEALLLKRAKADVNITVPAALDKKLANVLVIKGGAQLNDANVRALVTDLAALVDAKDKPFMTGLAHLGDEILIHDKYYRGEWINGQFFPYEFTKTHTTFKDALKLNDAAFKSVLQKYGLTLGDMETRFVEAESNPALIYGGKQAIDPIRSSEVTSRQSAVAGRLPRAAKAGGDVQSLIRQLRAVYLDAARNATPSQGAGAAYTADQLAYTKQKLSENLSKKLGPDAKTAITQLAVDAAVMSAPENAPFLKQQLPAGIAEMVFDSMQAIASGKKIDAAKLARRGSAEFLPTDNPVLQGALRAAVPKLAKEGAAMLERTTRNVDKAEVKGQDSLIRNAKEARLKAVKKFNAELEDMQKRGMLGAEDVSTARVNFGDAPEKNFMPDTPEAAPDVRATTIARIKALSLQAKSFAEKGGLTRAEAVQFRALMGQANSLRFDITRPLTLEQIPSEAERQSTLSARTTLTAREDLMRDKNVYTPIMDAAIGVSHNADTAVDEVMLGKNRDVSPDQFYRAFDATRAALRAQFGDTIHLFRATTQQKAKATTNWATTREFAASFGNNIVEKDVPVTNVLAVTVSPTAKYHEVIVGTPPSANINLMPEAMPNGTVYQADFGYQVVNKSGGKYRVYSPLGTIIAVANSLEEAKRVIEKKAR